MAVDVLSETYPMIPLSCRSTVICLDGTFNKGPKSTSFLLSEPFLSLHFVRLKLNNSHEYHSCVWLHCI
jgi:hypothetical protein